MSVYYREIGWKPRGSTDRPRRIVTSAYVLYPGEVLEHNRDYPETGVLPVVPDVKRWGQVRTVLRDLLRNGGVLGEGDR